nr:hypothetical protein [Tanacetum cinerariifolium]
MEHYMKNREHKRMIMELVENGPLIWPTIEENGVTRTKKYADLSAAEKIQADCDMKETNIILQGDDLISCLNKAMAFLTDVASSRVIMQQVQGRQDQSNSGTGEGHMARQCTQPKRPRTETWYMKKAMLAEAQEVGQILDEKQLAFLADLGVPNDQAIQTIILNNASFQIEDLDTYDFDRDDISNVIAVLMANISNYGSDVILEEKSNKEQNNESITAELERYKERVKTFKHRLNIDLSSREKMIDSQMDDMIKEKLALKEQVNSLEQNLSKQIKEKECLLQTFTTFKRKSKEKEDTKIENEIDLEKKIKELDNIIFKVGQYDHTVYMLTKPQAFYDKIHKQALGYQNLFYLKKAQRIKPTLYDGIVISAKRVAMPMIDDEETLILEEERR